MALSVTTALEKPRQQVAFALFQVCTGRPRRSTWSVNSRDYRRKAFRTLIDRVVLKTGLFFLEQMLFVSSVFQEVEVT